MDDHRMTQDGRHIGRKKTTPVCRIKRSHAEDFRASVKYAAALMREGSPHLCRICLESL